MANVIIKSDERKANTAAVLQAYGVRGNATASQREAAEGEYLILKHPQNCLMKSYRNWHRKE